MFKREAGLVVLSSIEGLANAIKESLGRQSSPVTQVHSLSNSEINDLISVANGANQSNTVPSETIDRLRQASYWVADPAIFSQILPLCNLSQIQWIHSTWAGPDKLIKQMKSSGVPLEELPVLTRSAPSSSPMGWDLAEWCLGHIIATERGFSVSAAQQKEKNWDSSTVRSYRSLRELTIGVMGTGTIGGCICQAAKGFQSTVWALGRSEKSADQLAGVDRYFQVKDIRSFLGGCDYVVNALPSTKDTVGLFDGGLFQASKPGSAFLNVGRGDLCTEQSLLEALEQGWIRSAILDVLPEEPLPSSSPLWSLPQVTISPHVGAVSFPSTVTESFEEEYKRLSQGLSAHTAIDWERGY